MLTLLYTPASPFARKVRMVALERKIDLNLVVTPVNPVERNETLSTSNPIAKIPTCLTPDGPLYDSRVICRYLDRLGQGHTLYASETSDYWQVQRLEALADGIMDAAVLCRYEMTVRPEEKRWQPWFDAQFARIDAALDLIERHPSWLQDAHIGTIALGAALEYLDFRHPTRPWRQSRPDLDRWLTRFAALSIMAETPYA